MITKEETRFVSHMINALFYLGKKEICFKGSEYTEGMKNMQSIFQKKYKDEYKKVENLFSEEPHSDNYSKLDKMLLNLKGIQINSDPFRGKMTLTLPENFISCHPSQMYIELAKNLN